ncbi:MAG: short-chain dehydrogenase, partial [Bacteroidetes bacterium]
MKLKNSKILITGGSSGLGKAMAVALVEQGANVVITGRDKEKLEKVANDIGCTALHFD